MRVFDVSVKVDCLNAKLLLALASTVILGFKYGTHDPVLQYEGSGSLPIYMSLYIEQIVDRKATKELNRHIFQECYQIHQIKSILFLFN
jgi:hypothetical protein